MGMLTYENCVIDHSDNGITYNHNAKQNHETDGHSSPMLWQETVYKDF